MLQVKFQILIKLNDILIVNKRNFLIIIANRKFRSWIYGKVVNQCPRQNVKYWYLWLTLTTFRIGNVIMHYKALCSNCFYGCNE